MTHYDLYTGTALSMGLRDLFVEMERRLELDRPLSVYIAGGMAVHLYTASRVTTDVDAELGARVHLPTDLIVDVELEDGTRQPIYLDTNYNSSLGLMHEDYHEDSVPVDLGLEFLDVRVLSPVDLAVSKISRLADTDRDDIAALVREKLTTADAIEQRALDAEVGYVGGRSALLLNIKDAVEIARRAEREDTDYPMTTAAERTRRIAGLGDLRHAGGTAYTFWRLAKEAGNAAGSLAKVDWQAVEKETARSSLGEHRQSETDVADALCRFSPGVVTSAERAACWAAVALIAAELQHRPDDSTPSSESSTPDRA